MKKIMTLTLIGALALGLVFTGTVNAESPMDNAKDKARQVPMMGTVKVIASNKVTITPPGMDFTTIEITTDDETNFFDATGEIEKGETPPEIAWNEIKKGDKVVVRGRIVRDGDDENATTSYLAGSVSKVDKFPRPDLPGREDKGPPQMNVILKSVSGNTLVVTDPAGEKEFEVTVSEDTKYGEVAKDEDGKPSRVEIGLSDLANGDKLVIMGKLEKDDEGNVTMNAMAVMVVDEFPPKRNPRDNRRDDKRREFMGTFNSWDGDYMVCTPALGSEDVRFKVTEDTEFWAMEAPTAEGEKPERIEMSRSDLSPGQVVGVLVVPSRNEDGDPEPTARAVIFHDTLRGRVGGQITSVSPTSITITIKRGEETVTLNITGDTKIQKHVRGEDPVDLTVADLAVGDFVGISYEDDNAIVIIKSDKPETPPEGDSEGPGGPGGNRL